MATRIHDRTRYRAPWGVAVPASEASRMIVVESGHAWLKPAHGEPIALAPRDVVVLPWGEAHTVSSDPALPARPFAAYVREPPVPEGSATATLLAATRPLPLREGRIPHPTDTVLQLRPGDDPALAELFSALFVELDGYVLRRVHRVEALLDDLFTHVLEQPNVLPDAGPVDRALAAVRADLRQAWNVRTMARSAGMSQGAFAKAFREQTGSSPGAFLLRCRMAHARRLLADTDANLADVANAVGYANEFSFGRAFKREMGVSPGSWRTRSSPPP
jgi:AraC-like DNA-binding protein